MTKKHFITAQKNKYKNRKYLIKNKLPVGTIPCTKKLSRPRTVDSAFVVFFSDSLFSDLSSVILVTTVFIPDLN